MRPHRFSQHVPDILDCLAQLSNDEVPTPPKVARDMLDLLPAEVWTRPDFVWLDPFSKSGVFLREVAARLLVSLADWEPDFAKRRDHILRNMLFGASITEMTGIISRRSLYCSADASGPHSVVRFDDPQGNLPFVPGEHDFAGGGRCVICNAPRDLERGDARENHAYSFVHGTYPTEEMKDMKFDVIVGNPPYQIDSDGNTRTMPIYQKFVDQAIAMNPQYVVMITPSRWFAGGLGLDDFRARMIADRRLKVLVDYPNARDCFPGVEIKGGVSYFFWDRDYSGDCEVVTRRGGATTSRMSRDLRDGDGVLLRDNQAASILGKIRKGHHGRFLDSVISSRIPYGASLSTSYFGESTTPFTNSIPLITGRGVGYISPARVEKNIEWIDKWKVLLPKAGDGLGTESVVVIGEPIAIAPGSVSTDTYLVAGRFDNEDETRHFAHYLTTKLARFLLLQRKMTQDIVPDRFKFVPMLDMGRPWTDEALYEHFRLNPQEVDYIERSIKPRSLNLALDSPVPASHLPGGAKYRMPKLKPTKGSDRV